MWAELGSGAGAVVLMGIIVNRVYAKMDTKQDISACKILHGHTIKELDEGGDKFEKILTTQTKMLETQGEMQVSIGKIEVCLEFIAKQNGFNNGG